MPMMDRTAKAAKPVPNTTQTKGAMVTKSAASAAIVDSGMALYA